MDDLISRQEALNMPFSNGINEDGALYVPWREVKDNLEKLPSAQPDLQPTCNQLATDCISRQEALDAVFNNAEHPDLAYQAIRNLPSAQQDITEKLYPYKCYITDQEGLQHEVIHTGDIRRVTGWLI